MSLNRLIVFRRERHQQIASVLSMLDSELLEEEQCFFGGGTAMALMFGEYRTSFDLDFLVANPVSFSSLRTRVRSDGLLSLFRPDTRELVQARPPRVDQYGIRSAISFLGQELKFEIVREARIRFETAPRSFDVKGVKALSEIDLIAEKLMANSDRYSDQGVFCRDLIDLAFVPVGDLRAHSGFAKAEGAYGNAILSDLKAAYQFLTEGSRLERSIAALQIEESPAQVLKRLNKLMEPFS
jgi:hypothetical protein